MLEVIHDGKAAMTDVASRLIQRLGAVSRLEMNLADLWKREKEDPGGLQTVTVPLPVNSDVKMAMQVDTRLLIKAARAEINRLMIGVLEDLEALKGAHERLEFFEPDVPAGPSSWPGKLAGTPFLERAMKTSAGGAEAKLNVVKGDTLMGETTRTNAGLTVSDESPAYPLVPRGRAAQSKLSADLWW